MNVARLSLPFRVSEGFVNVSCLVVGCLFSVPDDSHRYAGTNVDIQKDCQLERPVTRCSTQPVIHTRVFQLFDFR